MREFFSGKVIMVTGAAGSVGQELVRQLLAFKPAEIRAVDNNETELFFLGQHYQEAPNLRVFLGDVRDSQKLENLSAGVQVIFHAAAFKHVGLSEYNPFDAIQTNIMGVKNVIQASLRQGVERVIFTSSDKAVNPTNVMGTTKLMGERLISAANLVRRTGGGCFSSVRFGNVIGSRGSVLPIFAEQVRQGGPVTITHAHMSRFFMTVEEAVHLVLAAATLACGGEVFVTKMPVMRIQDLARALIDLLAPAYGYVPKDIALQFVGVKSGEKLFEELLTTEEMGRALEIEHMFVILPALKRCYENIHYTFIDQRVGSALPRPYNSAQEPALSVDEIKHYLLKNRLLAEYLLGDRESLRARQYQHLRLVGGSQAGLL